MNEHGLIEPFPTDDIEFALGVEWEMFRQKLIKKDAPFIDICTNQNACRLVALCERHNRFVETHAFYPGWTFLFVGNHK